MKNILFPLTFIALCGFFQSLTPLVKHMAGAYILQSQSIYDGTQIENFPSHQLKIYTDHAVMYANLNTQDSTTSFGVGYYTEKEDKVLERMIYRASGNSLDDTIRNFTLNVEPTPDGYKQVIPNIDGQGKQTLTEVYKAVGTGNKSAIDGVWKQTKNYDINGKDTTLIQQIVQYKTYYDGHFIWAHTDKRTAKTQTGMGFGTFEMSGTKIKETVSESTYRQIVGQVFNVDITMMGKDGYMQSIHYPDGTESVEIYTRLQ